MKASSQTPPDAKAGATEHGSNRNECRRPLLLTRTPWRSSKPPPGEAVTCWTRRTRNGRVLFVGRRLGLLSLRAVCLESKAKQSKAKQSKAKQSKAKQNKTKQQSQPTQRSALVHHSCKDRDDSHCKQRKQTHTFTFTFTLAGHFRHMPKVGPTHKNTQPTVSMHIIITLALDSLQTWTLIWLSECVCLLCLAVLGLLLCSGEMVGRSCLSFIHLFCHGAKQSKAKQRKEKKRKQGRKTVAATVQKEAGRALFFFFFFWFGLFVSFSAE